MSRIQEQREQLLKQKLSEMGEKGTHAGARPPFDTPHGEDGVSTARPSACESEGNPLELPDGATSYEAYREVFLLPKPITQRVSFNLRGETLQILRDVLSDLGEHISLSAYVDNILTAHLYAHRDLINREAAKRRRRVTIPK